MKDFTLHFFLRVDDQYQVKIEKDSEEAHRLEAVKDIISDEFLMRKAASSFHFLPRISRFRSANSALQLALMRGVALPPILRPIGMSP